MATFRIMLHPNKTSKKGGSKPVVLRVTQSGKRKYISLGYSCNPEFWDGKNGRFKKLYNPENYKEFNNNLKLKLAKAERIAMEFENQGNPFVYESFKDKFLIKNETKTVSSFFDYKIKELNKLERVGNADVYKVAKNALERFIPGDKIDFNEITVKFLTNYEAFLRKEGCSNNTINNYIRTLRALYNAAIDEGIANKDLYPFYTNHNRSGYKVAKLKIATVKRAITMEDLKKIAAYQPKELSYEQDAKLYFLFSYYAWGINFIDMAYLKWKKNIINNTIVYTRAKTRHTKTFTIPIQPQLQEILEHYKKYDNDGYIFPILNNSYDTPKKRKERVKSVLKKVNNAMKDIGKELKIPTPLTSYVFRHTFATILKDHDTSASVIKEMMGHADEKTTEIYLKDFRNDVLIVASEKLQIK